MPPPDKVTPDRYDGLEDLADLRRICVRRKTEHQAEQILRGLALRGDTMPFRPWYAQALRVLLAEYDRRLHEGSTVTVHVGRHRLNGVVKSHGNLHGPLIVVTETDCPHCGCPQSILSPCDCNCD